MIKLKSPRIPTPLSSSISSAKKSFFQPALAKEQPLLSDALKTIDPISGTATKPNAFVSKNKTDDSQSPPFKIDGTAKEAQFAAFQASVAAMNRSNAAATAKGNTLGSAKKQTSPVFFKPAEQERLKNLLLLADGGEEGAASGDYRYNQKTGKIEQRVKTEPTRPVVPTEHSHLANIMSDNLGSFDFTGWDDLSAKQQLSRLQRAGLSGETMMQLLNASTSLETIALVQDIERNRVTYGLSRVDVQNISDQLFEIANARVGAKNHDLPFLTSPIATNVFLKMLNEKEHELIGPFMIRKGGVDVPFPADSAKKDNRIPLKKGEYIDYNIVDLTDDLYRFMQDSAKLVKSLKDTAITRKANFTDEFIQLVKTNGALDIKNQEPWMFRDGMTYLFNGEVMRSDDPGNIAFGYYGAAVYGKDFLHLGAGYYQLKSDIMSKNPIQWDGKFFDDRQDYDMIEYGYRLYLEEHPD